MYAINIDSDLTSEVIILSSATISAAKMQIMDDGFLDRIQAVSKEDDTWMELKGELSQSKEKQEPIPNNSELEDGRLYFK